MEAKQNTQRDTANILNDTAKMRRIDDSAYAKRMQARYERFVQDVTSGKTEETAALSSIPETEIPVTPLAPTITIVPVTPADFTVLPPVPITEKPLVLPPTPGKLVPLRVSTLILQAQLILKRTPVAVFAIAACFAALFIQSYRLSIVPDIFSDEATYFLVGRNVALGNGFVVDHQLFLYHPPVFFLIEAAYIRIMNLESTTVISGILSARYLNIFFSAATASLLLLFGHKIHNVKAGVLMAALFILDPYVERINRRNMLETLSMFFLLLGFYLFFTFKKHLTRRQMLACGVTFGLAVLTKEPMFIPLVALIAIAAWTSRSLLQDALRVIAIASFLYLFYPLGEFITGNGPAYVVFKLTQLSSIGSSFTGLGLASTSQKTVSTQNTQNLLGQYASSYLLIALAAVSIIILFLYFRHLKEARYLIGIGIVSFGFGIVLGRLSDQYFYFLVVPNAIIVNSYLITKLFETVHFHRLFSVALSIFLCFLFIYNGTAWVIKYGYSYDNGYTKITTYITKYLPPGETIDASDDVSYYLLTPTYNMRLDHDPQFILQQHEHYFIMSSKDQWGGYDDTTSEFYNWVLQHSKPLVVEQEESFWTIGLYYMSDAQASTASMSLYSTTTPDIITDRIAESCSSFILINRKHNPSNRCVNISVRHTDKEHFSGGQYS